jgi:hypothetical protein
MQEMVVAAGRRRDAQQHRRGAANGGKAPHLGLLSNAALTLAAS